ncbi:acetyl-CoA carboxylase biotin carboxylase subunit family protein [Amycolatopsis sp. YIM 10]|uniref:ATP-grasp domain-containing protein n=1 Tax=Amycolatopsis sp. YIM 10 TaxID=2653857 RepID=UPI00128FFB22|nr:hypothetical protein [Amycolatopsis sp. YIM 10]QFU91056.1 hypothetical protein YIM_29450 [Amycolatopsis sp. YIM 10]
MRILVLNQNKFERVGYLRAIDHRRHDVVYAGTPQYVEDIPDSVRCGRFVLDPGRPVAEQLRPWLAGQERFDRLLARHELLILPAAELRAEFGIPGMRPELAVNFRDKVAMKAVLSSAGIRVPRFAPVGELPDEAPWPGKTIVKPRDSNASQGIELCDDYASARRLVADRGAADPGFIARYEVEEYLDGAIWHVDGYLHGGEPVAVQAARYVRTPMMFEHSEPLGSVQFPEPDLAAWAVDCVRALGGETLTFHLEAIMTATGPVFLEVAARCGGGHVVEMFRRRTGIHLHSFDMATEVDGKLARHLLEAPVPDLFNGMFLFPGHTYGGAPVSVSVPPGVLTAPVLVKHQILPAGVPTGTSANYRPENLAFSGLVSGPDPDELDAWIENVFTSVTVTPVR